MGGSLDPIVAAIARLRPDRVLFIVFPDSGRVVVAERASGLNEKRRGLRRLLRMAADGEIDVVLVEFKDRLARFGFDRVPPPRCLGPPPPPAGPCSAGPALHG